MEVTQHCYRNRTGFPGVIGSIDGIHIRIDKPLEDSDSYINRKQYFSIQLRGVVNHQRKFIDVFVGYPGSVHDACVFNESELNECLNNICGDGTYILADSTYPCLPHVLVPYRDNGQLTRAQINFNQKLSSCRITSENSFADLKQRFRLLYHFKLRDIVRMVQVIYACCILHNIANADDMNVFEPPLNNAYPDPAVHNIFSTILEEFRMRRKESEDFQNKYLKLQKNKIPIARKKTPTISSITSCFFIMTFHILIRTV